MKRKFCSGLAVVVVLFLVGVLAFAAVAQEVVLKPVEGKLVATDVYLKNSATGKMTKFLTINDAYRDHYHSAEYRSGYVYVIKRQGQTNAFDLSEAYTDELWRYSADGEGKKLWSNPGLDFRVNNDGSRIALIGSADKTSNSRLFIIKADGTRVKDYIKQDLGVVDMRFGGWVGSDLWIKEQETIDIYSLVRIDTKTLETERYDLSKLGLTIADYSFNAQSMILAYSDYPVFFDTFGQEDFEKAKTPVKLYVYDLKTGKRNEIVQSVAEPFNPEWVDKATLLFNNPQGKGKVKVVVK